MPPVDRYESTFIVSLDPTQGDFTSLQDAVNALPASGGKIFVKAGTYPLTNTVKINASNVQIQGEGMGITAFVAQSGMTGNTPALEAFSTASDGTPRTLLADTKRGDLTIQLSPTDAASFATGDFVLLFSDKGVDTESSPPHLKCAGEVKQITAADSTTGIITMDDQIFDEYTQAQSAQVVRITMLQNITLSDFSVTTQASSSQLRAGFTHFRFVENLQIERVEVHDAFFAGIQVQSVRNSAISGCYVHHINDILPINPPNSANERNGIVIGGASQNVTISDCRFSHTRHSVTTGGSSGKNQNGVQRNLVVANCTSMLADTAHFDTHQPAENVTFTGCAAIGGVPVGGFPATNVVCGLQMRARNCSIVGCSVLQAIGKGIMIFGPVSSGAVITGNMIANVKAIGNTEGVGIFFDSAGTSEHSVTGNVIKNCDGSAVEGVKSNNEIVISGNVIENVNSVVPGAAIKLSNASRILITGNNITASARGPAIAMLGNSDDWRILGNSLGGGTGVALVGSGSLVTNNLGYNPVGNISNPWPSSGADLTNTVVSGNSDPQSGVVYTVRHTPKSIVVTGGDVSQILINGADAGSTAGVFKLGVGETIAITYNTSPPAAIVFAE
jgi:hypothetical protein